jgi:hypothetical protein
MHVIISTSFASPLPLFFAISEAGFSRLLGQSITVSFPIRYNLLSIIRDFW